MSAELEQLVKDLEAVEEMEVIWNEAWSNSSVVTLDNAFEFLYDAGYRKQSGE